jgi:hypothetical protein
LNLSPEFANSGIFFGDTENLTLVCSSNYDTMSDQFPELPEHAKAQIIALGTKIADPATPPAHKSFLKEVLDLILKFLPAIIDLFHPSTTATLALGGPAVPGPAPGQGAPVAAPTGPATADQIGGPVDTAAAASL